MKRRFIHKELAAGRWYQLSLPEQLANIGSEVSRARIWQEKDKNVFWGAVERALELFDLSLLDVRWKGRLREIARVKEVFCDAVTGGKEYKSNLQDLDRYFLNFTFLSQRR
jgi:hypothetical protein